LTMAEVQASGRPPIALAAGGALEIIEEGRTGFLAADQTVEAFAAAMAEAREVELEREGLVESARRFDVPAFATAFRRAVSDAVGPLP